MLISALITSLTGASKEMDALLFPLVHSGFRLPTFTLTATLTSFLAILRLVVHFGGATLGIPFWLCLWFRSTVAY